LANAEPIFEKMFAVSYLAFATSTLPSPTVGEEKEGSRAVCVYTDRIASSVGSGQTSASIAQVEDIAIYQNEKFYSAFPSIVRRPDGELLVAFRRAPNRRLVGEKGFTHTDSNSQLVLVRSRDNGKIWSSEPELLYAHPFGGSQDPCMVQLRDGTILCASYGWMLGGR
jgi:hypothetical protein